MSVANSLHCHRHECLQQLYRIHAPPHQWYAMDLMAVSFCTSTADHSHGQFELYRAPTHIRRRWHRACETEDCSQTPWQREALEGLQRRQAPEQHAAIITQSGCAVQTFTGVHCSYRSWMAEQVYLHQVVHLKVPWRQRRSCA